MSRKLWVASGGKNLGEITGQREHDWETFASTLLSEFKQSNVTMAKYATLTREQKARIKNSNGWFVGGKFDKNDKGKLWRGRATLVSRSMEVTDLDHLLKAGMEVDDIEDQLNIYLPNIEWRMYSTPSSTFEDIRLRLVVPLLRDVKPQAYQPIGRWIAAQIGIEAFDHTGFEEARLMYLPVCLADGPKILRAGHGELLDPLMVLNTYDDWKDFGSWPSAEQEGGARQPDLKAEDPREKRGIIGAFCRCFSVQDAISRWLNDYFIPHDDNTYLPSDSSGAPGARVYDDGMFLYNNHETGPTSKRNLNAFDLVRIVKFGHLDKGGEPDDITKAESFKKMNDFALQQDEVIQEMNAGEFGPIDDSMDPTAGSPPSGPKDTEDEGDGDEITRFDGIAQAIAAIEDQSATRLETRGILTRIAQARFTPTDERALCRRLQSKYVDRPTTKDIEQELKDIRKQTTTQDDDGVVHDLELEILGWFEEEYFPNGTIKRIGQQYWIFEKGRWRMVSDEYIAGLFAKTIIRIRKERPEDAREIAALVGETKTSTLTSTLHRMMANLMAARETEEDPLKLLRRFDLPVINCRNKTIWFDENGDYTVKDHDPQDFFTTRVDADWDPEAECPLFDAFLDHCVEGMEDPVGMKKFLWELIAYILNQSRWLKIWVMFYGETDTGKSTLSESVSNMLGGSSIEKSLYTLDTKRQGDFTNTALIGKQLFIDDDLDKGMNLPDGAIKRLSEAKTIQTGVKFAEDIRFTSLCFPLVCTNHWPRTPDLSPAFTNRTLVVKFLNQFTAETKDDQIKAAMMKEQNGILRYAVAAMKDLRQRGRFDLPIDVLNGRSEWLENSNPVAGFVAARMVEDPGSKAKTTDVHESYRDWHYEYYGGSNIGPVDKREFYRRCDALMGVRTRYPDGEYYKGWRLDGTVSPLGSEFSDDLTDYEDGEDDLLE